MPGSDTQADRLRWAMERAGVKGAPLAERVGLSASYLSLVTRGKRALGGESGANLARALGVDAGWLLTGAGPAPVGYSAPTDAYPAREQALELLQGVVAPQVAAALRKEVPTGEPWSTERWVERALELQRLFARAKGEVEKKLPGGAGTLTLVLPWS